MKLTKENILSVCGKYLFIFYKNEKYGYWGNTSPSHIFAINKYGFVCEHCDIHYFNHYLDDNCKIFISNDWHNNYANLEDMDTDEEVDKESLKNFIDCIDNEYWVAYNQEYVNKLNKRIYELQKENVELKNNIQELNRENGKLEGFLEDEKMEYYELENFKNNEIKELKDKSKKIILRMIDILEDVSDSEDVNINMYDEEIEQIKQFLKELEND